jgi:hypothetical protein
MHSKQTVDAVDSPHGEWVFLDNTVVEAKEECRHKMHACMALLQMEDSFVFAFGKGRS